jgi:hypothetical protein
MFLLYHSEECNICEMVPHECYVNDLHTCILQHAVVCWVTTVSLLVRGFLHISHLYMYYILWPLTLLKYKLHIPNMVSDIGFLFWTRNSSS